MGTTGETARIKCQSCDWTGSIWDTYADHAYVDDDSDEIYCDNICPKCHTWQDITDYVIIHE